MDERRVFLKTLAHKSAEAWASSPVDPALRGETRIETRNTIYQLRDGVCVGVTRRTSNGWRADPTVFIGMRVVGWLAYENPRAGLAPAWRPGSYAVLWRPRRTADIHSSVALTSATLAFEKVSPPKKSTPPPLPARASSPPPPPPAPARTSAPPPPPPVPVAATARLMLQRPPTPVAARPPLPLQTPVPQRAIA
jgi:hypothetical protein